ncbi:MAG: hypothetical protein JWM19_138 [Actinomycetia bacterium]|nr:hypothetical protein [Actinomycetes bacterium]
MKLAGNQDHDRTPLQRAAHAVLAVLIVVFFALWLAASPAARRNRAWKNTTARQLGLASGTVLKREWNGVAGLDLSLSAMRPGAPEQALAELASAAAVHGYAREDFTATLCAEGNHIYPPHGTELPSLWIKILEPGQALCGQEIPPGHAGLSTALYGMPPGHQPRRRKASRPPAR